MITAVWSHCIFWDSYLGCIPYPMAMCILKFKNTLPSAKLCLFVCPCNAWISGGSSDPGI